MLSFQHNSPAIVSHEHVSNPHQLHFKQMRTAGLVSMIKTVASVGLAGMHKTGCYGETRLVLHIPCS